MDVQVVLRGQGKNFCAGIDLQSLGSIAALMDVPDSARAAAAFRNRILRMQVQSASLQPPIGDVGTSVFP